MTARDFEEHLDQRAHQAGISLPRALANALENYYRLLEAWNRKINLTGFDLSNPSPDVLDRLLIEPVLAATHAPAGITRIVDIGSGGGSPGIPFALAVGGVRLLMVESRTRKAVFLREAMRETGLEGRVESVRFEQLADRADVLESHDLLTIRAVRVEPEGMSVLRRFLRPGGELFWFKAAGDCEEWSVPGVNRRSTHALIASMGSQLEVWKRE